MKYAMLMLALAVSGCAHAVPPPRPTAPNFACPSPRPAPLVLPRVVLKERLADAYHEMDLARLAERKRGDACAEAVRQLHVWIKDTAS